MRARLPLLLLALAPACASAPASAPAPAPAPAPARPPAPAASPAPSNPAPLTALDPSATRAANTFATDLYAQVKRTPGNLLVSSTSLRDALAITLLGARGETARELASVLALPADPAQLAARAKSESASWSDARGGAELVVANRVWADVAFPLKPDFTAAASDAFGASAAPVDFANASPTARRTVNAWIAEKTNGKIPEVLAEGAVDKSTRLVVTNAIYFKARWSSPFSKANTKDDAFQGATKSNVPTMHATAHHGFAKVDGAKLLGMRYDGSELGMLLALPDDTSAAALAKLEDSLSAETFAAWRKAMTGQRVAVSLPRFGFAWGGSLERPLQDLGVHEAFAPSADFSGISASASAGSARLVLSRIVQKAWIAVDEAGTEAAAASGIAMTAMSASLGTPAEFKADHPFLFFVYDAKQGRILFAGRVTDPR